MTSPRQWALSIKLPCCDRACAGDALLCVPHAAIERVVEQAIAEAVREGVKWTA
jgi:hypothetical protein